MWWSRQCARRVRGWRWVVALAALAALACVRLPVQRASSLALPLVPAARVAHVLADFSAHPHADTWHLLDERGNYSQWSYSVSYDCGARCEGRAAVHTAAAGRPAHGHAPRHAVRLHLAACTRPPLLPWPSVCDETEVEWVVQAAGGGCELQEIARAWCGALRVLSGACMRELRDRRAAHLQWLRKELAHTH